MPGPMRWGTTWRPDTSERALTTCLLLAVFALACCMPAQNDTWWHLRTGEEMWTRRFVMLTDEFSFTAGGPWWNHEWLTDVVFYGIYRFGGMPALTFLCAGLVTGAVALAWALMTGQVAERAVLMAVALGALVPVWTVRPHVFTLFFTFALVHIVRLRRLWIVPPMFVIWANLHGGVALGLVTLIGLIAARVYMRAWHDARQLVAVGILAGAATFATPLGWHLWSTIPESVAKSAANGIVEWRPPLLDSGTYVMVWPFGIGLVLAAVWYLRRSPLSLEHASLLGAALAVLPMALRARRNVPPFLLLALPPLSYELNTWLTSGRPWPRQEPTPSRAYVAATLAVAVLCAGLVATIWTLRPSRLNWDPIPPRVVEAAEACGERVYNAYDDGGYLIWFARRVRVFIDSRQDPYSLSLAREHRTVERSGRYDELFERYQIRCAVLRPTTVLALRLREDGWHTRVQTPSWIVLAR